MKTLKFSQILPISIVEAWKFFSNPKNLSLITPPYMGFNLTSELHSDKMYPGMIITYRVYPLLGIPLRWVTEITQVDEPNYFIDNQKSGPYKFWHHQHFFNETDQGTEMVDIINLAAPFGWLGLVAERFVVEKKVQEIFRYRSEKLKRLFDAK